MGRCREGRGNTYGADRLCGVKVEILTCNSTTALNHCLCAEWMRKNRQQNGELRTKNKLILKDHNHNIQSGSLQKDTTIWVSARPLTFFWLILTSFIKCRFGQVASFACQITNFRRCGRVKTPSLNGSSLYCFTKNEWKHRLKLNKYTWNRNHPK